MLLVWSFPFCQFYHSFSFHSFCLFPCAFFFFFLYLTSPSPDYHINVVCSELIKMLHLSLFRFGPLLLNFPLYFYKSEWNCLLPTKAARMCSFQIKVILEAVHKSRNSPWREQRWFIWVSTLCDTLLLWAANTCFISRSPRFTIFLNPFLTGIETLILFFWIPITALSSCPKIPLVNFYWKCLNYFPNFFLPLLPTATIFFFNNI